MAQDQHTDRRTVSVSGEGTVQVAPDVAVVRFGVVTEDEEAEEARRQNNEQSSAAMNAVRELGIPDDNLQMERLQLRPKREFDEETRTRREVGFEATRQIRVTVEDLDLLPDVVTRAIQSGANRLQGVQYDLEDRSEARNDALEQAATNARSKAERLARTLDAELGMVRQIDEQSFSFPRPQVRQLDMAQARAADMAEPDPDAYAAGEIEVEANVQVVFDLVAGS